MQTQGIGDERFLSVWPVGMQRQHGNEQGRRDCSNFCAGNRNTSNAHFRERALQPLTMRGRIEIQIEIVKSMLLQVIPAGKNEVIQPVNRVGIFCDIVSVITVDFAFFAEDIPTGINDRDTTISGVLKDIAEAEIAMHHGR